jgi:CheY-like chemotaxis protein
MDLHLPGLSGFSVLQATQAGLARPPVIGVTGHDAPGNEARVTEHGGRACLNVTVDQTPLLGAIARNLQ